MGETSTPAGGRAPGTVTLAHPNLPGRTITVQRRSLPHYVRAGWDEVPPAPPRPAKPRKRRAPADAAPDASAETAPDAPDAEPESAAG